MYHVVNQRARQNRCSDMEIVDSELHNAGDVWGEFVPNFTYVGKHKT